MESVAKAEGIPSKPYQSFESNLNFLSLTELKDRLTENLIRETDEEYTHLAEICLLIRSKGFDGVTFLVEQLHNKEPNELLFRAIIFSLSFHDNYGQRLAALSIGQQVELKAVLHTTLFDSRPNVIAESLNALLHLEDRSLEGNARAYLHHESAFVRSSALTYLADLHSNDLDDLLTAALHDDHYLVRMTAIDEIDKCDAAHLLQFITPLLSDENQYVRQAAGTAISNLQQ